jgi:hypothetical protein
MRANVTHDRDKEARDMDLSVPFTLYIDDVARLMRITTAAARQQCYRGRIPVKPKPRATKRAPFEWSSLDWWKYYNGSKK